MSAHRPRPASPPDEVGLLEVLFYGVASPLTALHGRVWVPPTDVYETEDLLVVLVEIAGVQQADFSISLHERRLVISGRRVDAGPARRAYHKMELQFGDFRTDVELPVAADEAHISAEYNDGLLRVVLPKQKSKSIDVRE